MKSKFYCNLPLSQASYPEKVAAAGVRCLTTLKITALDSSVSIIRRASLKLHLIYSLRPNGIEQL